MKTHTTLVLVVFLFAGFVSSKEKKSLPEKLVDVTLDHIRSSGPDEDAAQFIATERFTSWERREVLAEATLPYLKDKTPEKVLGALAVLYRLRGYRPLHDINGAGGSAWEQKYKPAPFWTNLDKHVYGNFKHFHSVGNAKVFHNLALYLGVSPSEKAKQELIRIAKETSEKEQALICLAWHRDRKDMDSLLPFMLEDSEASKCLPYHFRNAYGNASIPYLKKAIAEAKSKATKREAEKELKILQKQ